VVRTSIHPRVHGELTYLKKYLKKALG